MMKIFRSVIVACLLCFNLCAQDKKAEGNGLNVLILGGTTFLGPHLTNELLSRGHKVTHFTRGNSFSFPGVENLVGDRDGNLKVLEGRKWDVVIDTSGYLPRVVEASSKILAKATRHYIFISSISVYNDLNQLDIDENSPLARLDDTHDETIRGKNYGPLKAGCEKVIQSYFPENSLIIRPGLIVGPYDPTDRFTYWVKRIADGGKVLLPNSPKQKLQFIDVRDLAQWIVKMIEEGAVGIYNATGPKEDLCFEQFINECSRFAKKKVEFIWADENFLIDHHLDNWEKLPLWLSSKSNMVGLFSINCQKAQDKGLSYRPLAQTIFDTLRWFDRINRKLRVGLSPEEEAIITNNLEKFSVLRQFNLPCDQYAITGSGPLGIRNLKAIGDIDIIVIQELWDQLVAKYGITDQNGVRKIAFPGGVVEGFQEGSFYEEPFDNQVPSIPSRIANAEMIDGLPFDSMETILYFKRKAQREKDLKDIRLSAYWLHYCALNITIP